VVISDTAQPKDDLNFLTSTILTISLVEANAIASRLRKKPKLSNGAMRSNHLTDDDM
jgi:hypothetical protein